jgi:hypothetical protein
MADLRTRTGSEPGPSRATTRGTRRTIALIAAVALAPIAASYAIYYLVPRSASVNYGTLLAVPAPAITGTAQDGSRFSLADHRGRWVLLIVRDGACDAGCERALYATRQARTMQGKEQERIVRVLALARGEPPARELVAQHPGLVVATIDPESVPALSGGGDAIYVIDPLGNLVMRYGIDPDIKGVAKDLARLLKASGVG